MGRHLTDVEMDNKQNGLPHDNVYVAPRISEGIESNEYEVKECTMEKTVVENGHEKQEVLGVKSANYDAAFPKENVQ